MAKAQDPERKTLRIMSEDRKAAIKGIVPDWEDKTGWDIVKILLEKHAQLARDLEDLYFIFEDNKSRLQKGGRFSTKQLNLLNLLESRFKPGEAAK